MTKEELTDALTPFTEELRVLIYDAATRKHYEVDNARYGLSDGEGVLVLVKGAQVLFPPVVTA